ncbi:hypothetical protein G6F57_021742 [Rhizopus arrhizus]|nr:hypothetical protein G6F57_021742 [Rhizopus arrhizus]
MRGETRHARSQRAGDLLHDDDGVQEIPAAAAVFFRRARQQDARRAGLAPQVARHQAFLFPLIVMGRDLVRNEARHSVAEQFMVRREELALLVHAAS